MSENRPNLLLRLEGISKSFPGVKALQNVSLSLQAGHVHALLGENGAGKSTLLKIISGAYQRDEGLIEIDGERQDELTPKRAQELGVSIIYQEFSVLPHLSIGENIFLGRLPRKKNGLVDWNTCYKNSEALLSRVGLELDPRIHVSELKVAQQQMVEIAKAISRNAKIIIMDEPTAPLTQREIDSLFAVIRSLRAQGVGILYVSHRLAEIQEICDEISCLRDGCFVGSGLVKELSVDDMIRMMVGRDLSNMYPRNINFTVRQGEILGLAGLVGAGRTELARAIFGADRIGSGEIYLEGKQINLKNPKHAISCKIGLVPEDRKGQGLVLMMNVKENITLASLPDFTGGGILRLGKEENSAEEYKEKLGIVCPGIFSEVSNLSGGNQQKVVLSKWLCANCKLLIVDEPTRGIDVGAKVEIYELINELVRSGIAIIMISSEMPELIGVCDRILVMHEGAISGELSLGQFSEENIMRLAAGHGEKAV